MTLVKVREHLCYYLNEGLTFFRRNFLVCINMLLDSPLRGFACYSKVGQDV